MLFYTMNMITSWFSKDNSLINFVGCLWMGYLHVSQHTKNPICSRSKILSFSFIHTFFQSKKIIFLNFGTMVLWRILTGFQCSNNYISRTNIHRATRYFIRLSQIVIFHVCSASCCNKCQGILYIKYFKITNIPLFLQFDLVEHTIEHSVTC
jgi:hypothetical protein